MTTTFKKTLLIDLDGVLNTYDGKYVEDKIPPIKEGAKDFIIKLSRDYKITIFTTRNAKSVNPWLKENGLADYIEEVTNVKKPAFLLIDDRCVRFENDYEKTYEEIVGFKPYWSGIK